ncbi:hypothetical protein QBC40DRAFT_319889 [Triangularia verruculosa]|uniref:SET domain-containing protein n=1 Tax=Triangularia verruculosa TaxID=2587418 RepID=A0AAN6X5B5_9PEZI|nr:hypothetical protein QBC40DRAFT_319889 [Triangularia verruculosa]
MKLSATLLLNLSVFYYTVIASSPHKPHYHTTCLTTPLHSPSNPTCPLESDGSFWSPTPWCPTPSDGFESGPPDCIFTTPHIRNQGLSVITFPPLAAALISPALDDSLVPPSFRRFNSSSEKWKIAALPNRGLGLVATGSFKQHESIMVGFPVLIVRLEFINGDRYSTKNKRKMLDVAVGNLPPETRKQVESLARSNPSNKKDWIVDVLRTNGFGIEIAGEGHLALFLEGSRVNHNCRPNAFWRWVPSKMAMEVVALRGIGKGEEVAHSYAPLGYTYEQRKAVLEPWGFQCQCALCSASLREREIADGRRDRILEIYETLSKAAELGSVERVDQLVQETMLLIEKEELQPQLVEYYAHFARAYIEINELKKAREYIQRADKMWLLYGGEEHENVAGMAELWKLLEEAEMDADDD